MTDHIKERVVDGAYEITIDRPGKYNALTAAMYKGLRDAVLNAIDEKDAEVVVLRAEGRAFCTGGDLDDFISLVELEPSRFYAEYNRVFQLNYPFELLMTCPKPVVCAVNGPAVGGGLAIVLAADIVIAGRSARFGMTEGKIGMFDHYVPELLKHKIGSSRSLYLGLTGNLIDSAAAERWGIAHEVVDDDQLEARTREVVGEVLRVAPNARIAYKEMISPPLPLINDARPTVRAANSSYAREGIRAFIEKRDPVWTSKDESS